MKNVSLNMEPLHLKSCKMYHIIDALYFNEFKSAIFDENTEDFLSKIRREIFPYTDTPFTEYFSLERLFDARRIRKLDYSEASLDTSSCFSTDTGLLIIINQDLIKDIFTSYNYNELVNSLDSLINYNYWGI